uniref:Uncharacterized protein n=1 Tax=Myoviridae sp. ctY1522 TaxID=2825124 RepID=A0A8S5TQZ5_9CAUD|nr:MAG TPA: hypothetical protein [Myoviridae sp. ctY1522]
MNRNENVFCAGSVLKTPPRRIQTFPARRDSSRTEPF